MDRFLLRVYLGYPDLDEEIDVLDRQQFQHPVDELDSVSATQDVIAAQNAIKEIYISADIKRYMVEVTRRTRAHDEVYLGASPRGSLTLYRASQARAALLGRDYVLPDDVKALVGPALGHRIIMGAGARLRDLNPDAVIEDVLKSIPVPGGPATP